jgi:hypothetical protein
MFANNPAYKEVYHSKVHDIRFYMPEDMANGYHLSLRGCGGAKHLRIGRGY